MATRKFGRPHVALLEVETLADRIAPANLTYKAAIGDWSTQANWFNLDTNAPAMRVPNAGDSVKIYQVSDVTIDGRLGNAVPGSLSVSGSVRLIWAGSLFAQSQLIVESGGSLSVSRDSVVQTSQLITMGPNAGTLGGRLTVGRGGSVTTTGFETKLGGNTILVGGSIFTLGNIVADEQSVIEGSDGSITAKSFVSKGRYEGGGLIVAPSVRFNVLHVGFTDPLNATRLTVVGNVTLGIATTFVMPQNTPSTLLVIGDIALNGRFDLTLRGPLVDRRYDFIWANRMVGRFAGLQPIQNDWNVVPSGGRLVPGVDLEYRTICLWNGTGLILATLTPDHGPANGGQIVTVTAHGLSANVTGMRFNGVDATYFHVVSDTTFVAMVPPGLPGDATLQLVLDGAFEVALYDDEDAPLSYWYDEPNLLLSTADNPRLYDDDSSVSVTLSGEAAELLDDYVDIFLYLDGSLSTPSTDSESPGGSVFRRVLLSGGTATFDIPSLTVGSHRIFANYLGDIGILTSVDGSMDLLMRDPEENTSPYAAGDRFGSPHGALKTLDILDNDSDDDHDRLVVSIATYPAKGEVTVNTDQSIDYVPLFGYSGSDSFIYSIEDGFGGTSSAIVTINLDNTQPVAGNDDYGSPHSSSMKVMDVILNDGDVDGDEITITSVGTPSTGTASIIDNKITYYLPTSGSATMATMTYTISDGFGGTSTANATIYFDNQSPAASDDTYGSIHSSSMGYFDVLANDFDFDLDELSVTVVTGPTFGSATVEVDGTITYERSMSGSATLASMDWFTYSVDDGCSGASSAVVTIYFDNRAPVTRFDEANAHGSSASIDIPVLDNDDDPDGDALTVTSASGASLGTLSIGEDDRSVIYTPNSGVSGIDKFTYTASDGFGGTSSNTVIVYLDNQAPSAHDDVIDASPHGDPVTAYVLDNDRDRNGDSLTLTLSTEVGHSASLGTVTLNSRGDGFIYTPNSGASGVDQFDYIASDGHGGTSTATVTVHLDNNAPVAADDTFGSPHSSSMVELNVLGNDYDFDGTSRRCQIRINSGNVFGGSVA